jgi:hypothetical protein
VCNGETGVSTARLCQPAPPRALLTVSIVKPALRHSCSSSDAGVVGKIKDNSPHESAVVQIRYCVTSLRVFNFCMALSGLPWLDYFIGHLTMTHLQAPTLGSWQLIC